MDLALSVSHFCQHINESKNKQEKKSFQYDEEMDKKNLKGGFFPIHFLLTVFKDNTGPNICREKM